MTSSTATEQHPYVSDGLEPIRRLVEDYTFSPSLEEQRPRILESIDNLAHRAEDLRTHETCVHKQRDGTIEPTRLEVRHGEREPHRRDVPRARPRRRLVQGDALLQRRHRLRDEP